MFRIGTFLTNLTISRHYGTFSYTNMESQSAPGGVLQEAVASFTTEKYCTWGMVFRQRARTLNRSTHPVLIVPANFNAMRFIYDPRTLPYDAPGVGNVQSHRTKSVKFVKSGSLRERYGLLSYKSQSVVAAAFINSGDKLFMDYVNTKAFV